MAIKYSIGVALMALAAFLAFADESAQGHGGLLGGLFRRRCAPMIVEPCVPLPSVPIPSVVEPAKKPLPAVSKDLPTNVKNIAALLKEGNAEDARKLAKLTVPTIADIVDLEGLYRPRNKGGLGWGAKAQANPATDGLEKGVRNFAKNVTAKDVKQTDNNVEAAYWIAAMAELTLAKTPQADLAKAKLRRAWAESAESLRAASLDLAKESGGNNAVEMKKAAARIDAACISCHVHFK
jgi:hypothetical protein